MTLQTGLDVGSSRTCFGFQQDLDVVFWIWMVFLWILELSFSMIPDWIFQILVLVFSDLDLSGFFQVWIQSFSRLPDKVFQAIDFSSSGFWLLVFPDVGSVFFGSGLWFFWIRMLAFRLDIVRCDCDTNMKRRDCCCNFIG